MSSKEKSQPKKGKSGLATNKGVFSKEELNYRMRVFLKGFGSSKQDTPIMPIAKTNDSLMEEVVIFLA